jgi:hypothetical protein
MPMECFGYPYPLLRQPRFAEAAMLMRCAFLLLNRIRMPAAEATWPNADCSLTSVPKRSSSMEVFEASRYPSPLRRPILCFCIVLVLSLGVAGIQFGLAQGTGQSVQRPSTDPLHLDWYIAARYSIFGPAKLASTTSQRLVFPGEHGKPGVTVSLSNKTVSVMNEAGTAEPLSSLVPGTNVVVCYRKDSVVIFLVQPASTGVGNVR